MSDDFDLSSLKKKKKSSKKVSLDEPELESVDAAVDKVTDKLADLNDGEGANDEGDEENFEFKKKKKKKSSKTVSAADDFDQALQDAGVDDVTAASEQAMLSERDIKYNELLTRFFEILRANNPDLAGGIGGVKFKLPLPIVNRDGNKKTMFANVKEISDKLHRPTEHVIQFLFAELGTSGSVDGANRLIIKGRFQQKQIGTVLRKYAMEYVSCKTCKSVNTRLTKENRLYFLDCNSCGSRRSVQSIKAGYQAVIGRRALKKNIT